MDLITRFHHFLFEIEKHLRKPRLLLRQCEHGLIYDLQAQCSWNSLAVSVCHSEANARVVARFINLGVGHGDNCQFIRRLHKQQTMVAYRLRVTPEQVCTEVQSPSHFRGGKQRKFRLAVVDVQVARQNGLAFLDDVNVGCASLLRGKDPQLNTVSGTVHGVFCL